MFRKEETLGNHTIYKYDTKKHPFIQYFKNLYNEPSLDMLHLNSFHYNVLKDKLDLGGLNEIDTDLHSKFYNNIKTNLQVSSYSIYIYY